MNHRTRGVSTAARVEGCGCRQLTSTRRWRRKASTAIRFSLALFPGGTAAAAAVAVGSFQRGLRSVETPATGGKMKSVCDEDWEEANRRYTPKSDGEPPIFSAPFF